MSQVENREVDGFVVVDISELFSQLPLFIQQRTRVFIAGAAAPYTINSSLSANKHVQLSLKARGVLRNSLSR